MMIWAILALFFAILEAIAVSKHLQRLEYIAKPAVMIFLFLWLFAATGLRGNALWFGWGVLFSLVGDVLLMFSTNRFFLLGLVAFLIAHLFYIAGFGNTLTFINTWSLILLVLIGIVLSRLLDRIVSAMRARGNEKLIFPVILYGTVISVMLYAAMSTNYDSSWSSRAAFFVSMGAFLFVASDAILAWNKFVSPLKNGRVWNMTLYHLGQMGLIAGVISRLM